MANYLYGAGMMACVTGLMSLFNTHMPNSVYYYVDLFIPF